MIGRVGSVAWQVPHRGSLPLVGAAGQHSAMGQRRGGLAKQPGKTGAGMQHGVAGRAAVAVGGVCLQLGWDRNAGLELMVAGNRGDD